MLTQKEYKFLKLLFKFLDGKHVDFYELNNYIKERFHLSDKISFEMAYLYDYNWTENGFSQDQEDVKRMSYEDYKESLPLGVKIMMEFKQDFNPSNYETDGYGDIIYDGTEYKIYSDINDLIDIAVEGADWICDDPEEWAESYVYMSEDQRSSFADEQADSYFDDLDDEEIIDRGDIHDQLEELEKQRNDSENNESEEEIEEKRQEIIDEERERLKEQYRDEIYTELNNPVEYFVGNGIYNSVRQLVRSGPVEFDCDSAKNDYFDNADYGSIVNSAGYDGYDTIIYERKEYYIVWN